MGSRLTWQWGPVNCMESFHTVHSTLMCKPLGKRGTNNNHISRVQEQRIELVIDIPDRHSWWWGGRDWHFTKHIAHHHCNYRNKLFLGDKQPALCHQGALLENVHKDLQSKQVKQDLKQKNLRMNMMLGTRWVQGCHKSGGGKFSRRRASSFDL